jgi:class 3 adenylate cyclase
VTKIAEAERRLVAIFAADVEGYGRLMGANEVETLQALTQRRAILDDLISSHRGRIANTASDSVLAEFGSVVDAVQCASRRRRHLPLPTSARQLTVTSTFASASTLATS